MTSLIQIHSLHRSVCGLSSSVARRFQRVACACPTPTTDHFQVLSIAAAGDCRRVGSESKHAALSSSDVLLSRISLSLSFALAISFPSSPFSSLLFFRMYRRSASPCRDDNNSQSSASPDPSELSRSPPSSPALSSSRVKRPRANGNAHSVLLSRGEHNRLVAASAAVNALSTRLEEEQQDHALSVVHLHADVSALSADLSSSSTALSSVSALCDGDANPYYARRVFNYHRHELPALIAANACRPRAIAAFAIESRNSFSRLSSLPTLGPLQMIEQYALVCGVC